jgi:transketolase
VLPPAVRARVSVEAGVTQGWWRIVGECGDCVGLEHFGASAPYQTVYEQFGIAAERVVAAAHRALVNCRGEKGETTGN